MASSELISALVLLKLLRLPPNSRDNEKNKIKIIWKYRRFARGNQVFGSNLAEGRGVVGGGISKLFLVHVYAIAG